MLIGNNKRVQLWRSGQRVHNDMVVPFSRISGDELRSVFAARFCSVPQSRCSVTATPALLYANKGER